MKPIFCGNFEYDARQSDLERLFKKYGKVDRVDMKSGFAFVYMEDEGDAEYAIRKLDNLEFGRKGRRLRVEWTKQERSMRKPENSRRSAANLRPSKTLFVINFDPYNTRTRDLERHFEPYGKILNIRIRKNFAFIQFEVQEDAIKALEATNMSKLMDRVISVEYAIKDDDDRVRDRSPRRRNDDRGRSPSPYRRERGSPDYSHGPGRGCSPSPYRRERASPDYGRGGSGTPNGKVRKSSGRGGSVSPIGRDRKSGYGRSGSRSPNGRDRRSDFGRGSRSPVGGDRKPEYARGGSRSPNGRERRGDFARGSRSPVGDRKPDYGRGGSPDRRGRKAAYGVVQSPSPPNGRERISKHGHGRITSPEREVVSPEPVRRSIPKERLTPEYDHGHSPSPQTEKVSPDGYNREGSPDAKPEIGDSPGYSGGDSPMHERYSSRSPPARGNRRDRRLDPADP